MKVQEILTEGLQYNKATRIIDKFIEFAASELQLDELPDIDLQDGNEVSVKHKSFGGYGNKHITVTLSNRHIMDVCRTLAHELVHYRQDMNNELTQDSGNDGSPPLKLHCREFHKENKQLQYHDFPFHQN
jgi:hypothetical protein